MVQSESESQQESQSGTFCIDTVRQIGEYEIQEKLGEGGMGVVFRGYDPTLRRHVAIKALLPDYAINKEARGRFLLEARSAASISHDNVVTIHHVGDHQGAAYLVMPLLKGVTLETFFQKKGLPTIPQAIRIAREIAAGLGAAHKQGLIHRDVKPANIWLESPNGRVKILDFGIAKPVGEERRTALTDAGVVMGTPAFMSPEQARGHVVDSRSDLYSLGALLYRMCTGVPPFMKETVMETLTALVSEPLVPPRQRNPKIPAELDELITQLLSRKPDDRPADADEVIRRLRSIERPDQGQRRATGIIAADAAMRISSELPTTPPGEPEDPGFEIVHDTPDVPAVTRKTTRRKKKKKLDRMLVIIAGIGILAATILFFFVMLGLIRSLDPRERTEKQNDAEMKGRKDRNGGPGEVFDPANPPPPPFPLHRPRPPFE